jgi:hypothetical protein
VASSEGHASGSLDIVSPELVLIDPALSEHARTWLPEPGDTLRRVERLVHAHRIAALRAGRAEALGIPREPPPLPPGEVSPAVGRARGPSRSAALAGASVAAALVAALLVGVRVDLRGNPAGADTAAVGVPPVTTPSSTTATETPAQAAPSAPASGRPRVAHRKTQMTKSRRGPGKKAQVPKSRRGAGKKTQVPRNFAWAPVAKASAYHVELFHGASLVLALDTKRPSFTLGRRWTFGGEPQSLRPGEYRWYVWPVVGELRSARAVVQASLHVPAL